MSRVVAAIDCGTNSTRVLIARVQRDGGLETLDRRMEVTRLGAGVDATGHLDDAALTRTLDAIDRFAAAARARGADGLRIAATSAVRDATDRERFFGGVRAVAGTDAEVLTGHEEAALAFAGAVGGVEAYRPVCVLDIGGGSTELIVGDAAPTASTSRQLGCVRLTERCLSTDPPSPDDLAAARGIVDTEMAAAAEEVPAGSAATLIGVAGTVTTVGALHLGLDDYIADAIHGTVVDRAGVAAVTERLIAMTSLERAALGPMAPGREDVIVGGCLVLEGAMDRFGFDAVTVSETDILDGLAASRA